MTDRPDEDLRSQWARVTDGVVEEMLRRLDLGVAFTESERLRFKGALDFIAKMECLGASLQNYLAQAGGAPAGDAPAEYVRELETALIAISRHPMQATVMARPSLGLSGVASPRDIALGALAKKRNPPDATR